VRNANPSDAKSGAVRTTPAHDAAAFNEKEESQGADRQAHDFFRVPSAIGLVWKKPRAEKVAHPRRDGERKRKKDFRIISFESPSRLDPETTSGRTN
jgi:hypothetical protein